MVSATPEQFATAPTSWNGLRAILVNGLATAYMLVRRHVFARMCAEDQSFLSGVLAGMFTVPGDGGLDFAVVLRALADVGYAGWIVVEAEQDPAKADPRTYAELGLATLERAAAAAGLQ